MRQILTDYARRGTAAKRGGPQAPLTLDESLLIGGYQCDMLGDLDEALTRLAAFAPRQAQVVERLALRRMAHSATTLPPIEAEDLVR
jgi:hypothetical protein